MREQVIASRGSRNPSRSGREFCAATSRRGSRGGGERRSLSIRSLISYAIGAQGCGGRPGNRYLIVATAQLPRPRCFGCGPLILPGLSNIGRRNGEFGNAALHRGPVFWRADVAAITPNCNDFRVVRRAVVRVCCRIVFAFASRNAHLSQWFVLPRPLHLG